MAQNEYGPGPVSSEAGQHSDADAGSSRHSALSIQYRESDDEISLLDIAIVLVKHKKLVLGLPFLSAIVTAGITLLMPNIYTGRAVLMPPQQQQSTAAMMLGQLGVLTGAAGSLGLKNPNDLYLGILKSRTISDALIERFNLLELYDEDKLVETREELADKTTLTSGKDGLIVIEVDDEDPKRAADMANAYVEELERLTTTLAVSEAGQRRLFFERQLAQAKDDLVKAEIGLKNTQERTGLVQLDQQGRAMIEAVATMRAQIVAREVDLAVMGAYATEKNPELIKIQQELAGLKSELRKLERGAAGSGDLFVSTRKIPEAGLEYVRMYRDVKYAETLFEVLAKQFELAKVDESRNAAIVQIVDRAVALDKKTKPKRSLIVAMVVLATGLMTVLYIFLVEIWKNPPNIEIQLKTRELTKLLSRKQ